MHPVTISWVTPILFSKLSSVEPSIHWTAPLASMPFLLPRTLPPLMLHRALWISMPQVVSSPLPMLKMSMLGCTPAVQATPGAVLLAQHWNIDYTLEVSGITACSFYGTDFLFATVFRILSEFNHFFSTFSSPRCCHWSQDLGHSRWWVWCSCDNMVLHRKHRSPCDSVHCSLGSWRYRSMHEQWQRTSLCSQHRRRLYGDIHRTHFCVYEEYEVHSTRDSW